MDVGVDVLGVHDSTTKGFLRYTVSLLGYGFHGDILDPSERMRFLGPSRYDIAGESIVFVCFTLLNIESSWLFRDYFGLYVKVVQKYSLILKCPYSFFTTALSLMKYFVSKLKGSVCIVSFSQSTCWFRNFTDSSCYPCPKSLCKSNFVLISALCYFVNL